MSIDRRSFHGFVSVMVLVSATVCGCIAEVDEQGEEPEAVEAPYAEELSAGDEEAVYDGMQVDGRTRSSDDNDVGPVCEAVGGCNAAVCCPIPES